MILSSTREGCYFYLSWANIALSPPLPAETHSPSVLIPPESLAVTFLECFKEKCFIFLWAYFFLFGEALWSLNTRISLFPQSGSPFAQIPVMWFCGIWQPWETAQPLAPLAFPATWEFVSYYLY